MMQAPDTDSIRLKLIYDGLRPVHWTPSPDAFGLQDKNGELLLGRPGPQGVAVFEVRLKAKAGQAGALVLSGDFAHGPPGARFLYLSWRSSESMSWAQRLKLPLGEIGWSDVRNAIAQDTPLVGRLLDHQPRATSTGANIGGTRPMTWTCA